MCWYLVWIRGMICCCSRSFGWMYFCYWRFDEFFSLMFFFHRSLQRFRSLSVIKCEGGQASWKQAQASDGGIGHQKPQFLMAEMIGSYAGLGWEESRMDILGLFRIEWRWRITCHCLQVQTAFVKAVAPASSFSTKTWEPRKSHLLKL